MSTDTQNPRYSYLTFNRVINGTGSFELDIAGSTIYRLDTNTSTVDIKLNNSGNSNIPLISKRRIDVGSNGFTKIIVSHTAIAAPETLTLLIGDSESSNTDLGVEISDYSTSITGAITIGGTVDVDIIGQTGQDPLHNDIVQVDGSNPAAVNWKEYLLAGSPEDTQTLSYATGWNSGTGYTVYTAASDSYIFSANLHGLAINVAWQPVYLEVFTAAAVSRGRLLNFALQGTVTIDRLQGSTTFQSSMPYKLNTGDYVQIVAGVNVTASCNLQIIVP